MGIKSQIKKLPGSPGIYLFSDKDDKLLYVGKSVSIKKRVASYFIAKNLGPKTNLLVTKIAQIEHIKVFSEFEALLLEAELIKKNQPFFNIQAKDDKSPLYIKIAGNPPLVSLVRRQKTMPGTFLKGPFPSAKSARRLLRLIRKIFPFCHHKNPPKPCLYVHLGLCPYPYQSQESKLRYIATIDKIKRLLSGKSKSLMRSLRREMQILSIAQKYEQADQIKKQIEQLQFLTTTYHAPSEFLERPTLVDDLALARLTDLAKILSLKKLPRRIECYDIANIQGKLATGSMVVFESGQPQKDQYRRFRIKFTNKPDDYQMLTEVLRRRFKNDWPRPDLVIIDGGRGQLNVALTVTEKFKITVKVIALSKRYEEIHTADRVLPLALPKESPARQLAQAVRDEAHRFANAYHRLLRSKQLFAS